MNKLVKHGIVMQLITERGEKMFEYTLEFPSNKEGNPTNEIVVKTECVCNGKKIKEATFSEDEAKKEFILKHLIH